jgi:heme A synthase
MLPRSRIPFPWKWNVLAGSEEERPTVGPAASQKHGYAIHIAVGSAIVLVMLLLPIVAWRGRLGPAKLKWSWMLAALGILQAILGSGESIPTLGLLHGLVAVVIVAASGALAHRTWTDDPAPTPSPAAPA